MKNSITAAACLFIVAIVFSINSCSKDKDGSGKNHKPVANAGPDIELYPPSNSTVLDGSSSTDPDNDIVSYDWKEIAGPSAASLTPAPNGKLTQVLVKDLLSNGTYEFELTVTDAGGLFSNDKVLVKVFGNPNSTSSCDGSTRPVVYAQLVPVGTLSQARSGMCAVASGSKLFFASGGGTTYADGASAKVDIFDTVTQVMATSNLSVARSGVAAIAVGNKIYFAGGDANNFFGPEYSTIDIYDLQTNTWSVSNLSEPRSYVSAATLGTKVFFAGGYINDDGVATDKVDIYDVATNTWTTAHLSQARGCVTAVVANNKIYFAGGNNYSNYSNQLDIYDNATGTWSSGSINELEGGWFAGLAISNKIYWAIGCKMAIRDVASGNVTSTFLAQRGWWRGPLGENAVVKGNKIIFFRHFEGSPLLFDIYDISTNSWSIGNITNGYFTATSILSTGNTIYIAGGWRDGDYTKLSNQVFKLVF